MYYRILCLFFLIYGGLNSYAQKGEWAIDTSMNSLHIDFSNNDKYIVLENEQGYEVWNTESKTNILKGTYRNKIGRNFADVYLTEGSAYLLFEEEDIFLQIDYTLNFTNVDAFDLKNGNKLWSIDNLDMQISTGEAIYQLLENAQRFVRNEENIDRAAFIAATGIHSKTNRNSAQVSYVGHDKIVNKLINYLPQRNAIAVNGKESLQLLDIKTGEIIWQQPELKGAMGEIFYDPQNDILVAVRINQRTSKINEIKHIISRPEVQALNAKNGDLLWNIKYNGDFVPDIAYIVDETLVLPYFGLMLIDIKTGEERDGDIKEAMQRERRVQRNMSILGSEGLGDNCSYPILDENGIIHYVVGYAGGKHINPSGSRKAYLQIDIHQDKIVLANEGIAKQGNYVIQEEMTDNLLYVKLTRGLSSSYIMALDRNTGKIVFETNKAKNRFGTEYDPFLLSENRIVDISAKGVHIYDAQTGKEINTVTHKNIGVGRFRNQMIFDKGLVLLGTNGVAIIDDDGNPKETFMDTGRIKGVMISDEIWLLDNKKLIKIATDPIAVIEEIEYSKGENIFFSPAGTYIAKINRDNKIVIY